jgi:hypothetical protein
MVFGSRTMWKHLLVAGLVDELHLMVASPALLPALSRAARLAKSAGPSGADRAPSSNRPGSPI